MKRAPIHPGELLREDVLPSLGISISEAARRMGVSPELLHRILTGASPITPKMALRIGRFVGNGPDLWLKMQQNYDLWQAEQEMREELSRIEPVVPLEEGAGSC